MTEPDDRPRTAEELQTELARVEALVWYSRARASIGDPDHPGADAIARIRAEHPKALAAIDFDDAGQVLRLEGQQAALRWALSRFYDELSTMNGEGLYDS